MNLVPSLTEMLQRPESEEFDRKGVLDPTNAQDYLELVAHLVAMANTRGGSILIGTQGSAISRADLPLFDSARIDDRVNSLIEPRVGGIKSSILGSDFVLIEIEKSGNPPHIFKQDGNCNNRQQKPITVFRRGDAYVRHSSKSERANRTDFERWLEARQQRLFENVKLVFQASPEAQIQIAEGSGGMPVRIDPNAPNAQPVYDLLTADPFRDLEQELMGALKAWKTSHQLLNEAQIYKAYAERNKISNPEVIELLLKSSWEHHMQGYLWAARLDAVTLVRVIREVVTAERYPASQEALKIAAMLPREHVREIFQLVEGSYKKNIKKAVKKLEPVLRARARKFEAFVEALCPGQRLTYKAGEGLKEVKIEAVIESTFDEILNSLLEGRKENRGLFKLAELLVFGRLVTNVDFSALTLSEEAPAEHVPPGVDPPSDVPVSG
jgi:schlafen family protein